jgi:hypothetical protein
MDLNLKVVGKEEKVEEYDYRIEALDLNLKVGIKYVNEKEVRKINQLASKSKWSRGKKEEKVDTETYNLLFMRACLVYIKGLTVRGLKYLIEKDVVLNVEGPQNLEIPVDNFKEAVKEIIVNYVNWKFFTFCFERARDVIDEETDEVELETENL